jgi:hypothetical protein
MRKDKTKERRDENETSWSWIRMKENILMGERKSATVFVVSK